MGTPEEKVRVTVSHPEWLLWDPCWRGSGVISLATERDGPDAFFMRNSFLTNLEDFSRIDVHGLPNGVRLCAGSFDGDEYLGSYSNDVGPGLMDQSVFRCDSEMSVENTLTISSLIGNDPGPFSGRRFEGRYVCACRDPTIDPNGEVAVVTGGHRWNAPPNVSVLDRNLNGISRESIIGKGFGNFNEIERPFFIDDVMFFSGHVKGLRRRDLSRIPLFVARRNSLGTYDHHGEIVENSHGCYGADVTLVDGDPALTYWRRSEWTVVYPTRSNLRYERGRWSLVP